METTSYPLWEPHRVREAGGTLTGTWGHSANHTTMLQCAFLIPHSLEGSGGTGNLASQESLG